MIRAELNQSLLKGGQRLSHAHVERVLKTVSKVLNLKEQPEVSIAFIDEKTMKRLNAIYRGKNKITDVLSFGSNNDVRPPRSHQQLGELVLSYEQAKRQAVEQGHCVRDEVILLIVHGLLHLFGYDHERSTDAKKMFVLQERILRILNVNPTL